MYWMHGWTVNTFYFNVPGCDDTSPFPLGYPDPANHILSFSLTAVFIKIMESKLKIYTNLQNSQNYI